MKTAHNCFMGFYFSTYILTICKAGNATPATPAMAGPTFFLAKPEKNSQQFLLKKGIRHILME
jgi:hypothetical protein